MNLRWLLFDFVDHDLPLTFRQRIRIVWRPLTIGSLPRWVRTQRYFTIAIVAVPLFLASGALVMVRASIHAPGVFSSLLLLYGAGSWIWGCLLYRVFGRSEYYYRIRLEGFDVCLKCGYWLRALDDDVKQCPECGAKREPMPEPAVEAGPDDPGALGEEGSGRLAQ